LLDVLDQEKGVGNELVPRFRFMRPTEILDRHAFRQVTWVPDLQTVIKDTDLHIGRTGIIPMTDGIDNDLPQAFQGILPSFLAAEVFDLGSHPSVPSWTCPRREGNAVSF
jgi:hypothetical protein